MNKPEMNEEDSHYTPKFPKNKTKRTILAGASSPHRVMSAGQAILFVFLAVIFGIIFNSSSLYLKAAGMKPSWKKSVATTTLRPFDLAIRALGLNTVRQQARSAMDLPRDDKVDDFAFKPEQQTRQKNVTSPALPVISPENKLRMWIIGDSLSVMPGESMLRSFPTSTIDILGMSGQISTGLARPDYFNWFSHINEFVLANHPALVVATFGANDDQYLFSESGSVGPFGSDAWRADYANRVGSTLDFLASQGTHTIWIAIPPVRDPIRNDRYKIINEVTRAAVLARPTTASYIETQPSFTMPDGTYSDSIDINGTMTLVRAPDGIHVNRAGGDIIAGLVMTKLHQLYSFQ